MTEKTTYSMYEQAIPDVITAHFDDVDDERDYRRALAAEPALLAAQNVVVFACTFTGPDDQMCNGCFWESTLKPLIHPLIGWERHAPEKNAPDRKLTFKESCKSLSEIRDEMDALARYQVPAETETERWMRSSDAWDAMVHPWLAALYEADPGNGCAIVAAPRSERSKS